MTLADIKPEALTWRQVLTTTGVVVALILSGFNGADRIWFSAQRDAQIEASVNALLSETDDLDTVRGQVANTVYRLGQVEMVASEQKAAVSTIEKAITELVISQRLTQQSLERIERTIGSKP